MNRSPFSIYGTLVAVGIFILSLSSCEKEVHIKLAGAPPQVVVEGQIETGLPPFVFLSSSIGFFSEITLSTLENSFLHDANISVSDGIKTVNLKEYSFDTGSNNKFYVYTVDTSSAANIMLGEEGKIYTLAVLYNGVTYKSVTKIPTARGVDSAWFGTPVFQNSKTPDSAKQLFANYTDPDTPGNYARYFTRRNSEQFFPIDVFSDEVVNGKRITNISLYAGYLKTVSANKDSLLYFYPGDTVTLKWSQIDKGVYTFWNTYEYANNALGNPFASPINVQTNISNGALGVWAGYGSSLTTLVVP